MNRLYNIYRTNRVIINNGLLNRFNSQPITISSLHQYSNANITNINSLMITKRLYSNSSNSNSNDNNKQQQEEKKQQEEQQDVNSNNKQYTRTNNRYQSEEMKEKNKSVGMWVLASIIAVLGMSYAAVPLYRMFCRVTGYGGTVRESTHDLNTDELKKRDLANKELYPIKVTFTSSIGNKIPWTFKPVQSTIEVIPGEPVLAFYRATNHTDQPIIGVATYNITPMKAGIYFTKIQCFCFDEQRIKPNETIDMPVLFVVEPEMLEDKNMKGITDITLSYTFFKSNDQGELEEI